MPTRTSQVERSTSHLDQSCRPASGWMGERALDSRGGENDGTGVRLTSGVSPSPLACRRTERAVDSRGGENDGTGAVSHLAFPRRHWRVGATKKLWIAAAVRKTGGGRGRVEPTRHDFRWKTLPLRQKAFAGCAEPGCLTRITNHIRLAAVYLRHIQARLKS